MEFKNTYKFLEDQEDFYQDFTFGEEVEFEEIEKPKKKLYIAS